MVPNPSEIPCHHLELVKVYLQIWRCSRDTYDEAISEKPYGAWTGNWTFSQWSRSRFVYLAKNEPSPRISTANPHSG